MNGAVIVAVIATGPPTLAALLTFFATRSSSRLAIQERAAVVTQSLETLHIGLARVEASVERIESGVTDLRERVAHLEGSLDAGTRAS